MLLHSLPNILEGLSGSLQLLLVLLQLGGKGQKLGIIRVFFLNNPPTFYSLPSASKLR